MNPAFQRLIAAVLVLAAAAFTSAHEDEGVLDLGAIDARIDARLDATTGREHRAYAALARVLRRPNHHAKLAIDVAKLLACARACTTGALIADTDLRAALAAPEDQADALLAAEPEMLAAAASRLERERDRTAVTSASDRAASFHEEGRALRGVDETGMLLAFRNAAGGFARTEKLAARLLRAQSRRGSPGQPLPKGPPGTIDTFAGSGLTSGTPDGTPALSASFYFPMDLAVDPRTGLVHVVDYNNHQIRVIDAQRKVRTVLASTLFPSSGTGLEAPLDHPAGVAFDPVSGDLYVAGWHAGTIVRVDAARTAAAVVGGGELGDAGDEGPLADARFDYPANVAFDAQGGFYVADQFNQRVRYVDPTGTVHAFAGTGVAGFSGDDGPAKDAQLANPEDAAGAPTGRVALSSDGAALFVADTANRRIRRIDIASGTITTYAGTGAAGSAGDGGLAKDATFDEPVDVDCDAAGNVYVCDRGVAAHVVRRIDGASGRIASIAGVAGVAGYSGDGRVGNQARLRQPSGIFVDRTRGRVYVADTGNHVIRVVWE
jgi:sugar lactone lactonase YvrE